MNIKETQLFIAAGDIANRTPLIEGKHGVGKSDVIRQYAASQDMHCETLILSLMDVGDLIGLPRTIEIGGTLTTAWAAPTWFNRIIDAAWPVTFNYEDLEFKDSDFKDFSLPRLGTAKVSREALNDVYCEYTKCQKGRLQLHLQSHIVAYKYSKRSILFLDELNRSPVDILNASLQLVLDKRLNDHQLPVVNGKPTFITAAINPADADYTVNTFDPALLDRFMHGEIEADAKAWLDDFARPNNLAPIVRDFIAEHPKRIHYTPKDGKTGATPRSWTALAEVITNIDQIPKEIHFQVFKGCIGTELAAQFLSYFNSYSKVVKLEDIEKLVITKAKRIKKVETLGEHVAKLIKDQEAIQKTELAENLFTKYINQSKAADALPLLAYLYALDLEILNAFLKNKKNSDVDNYRKLATLDGELNNKNLFKKITTKIKG